MRLRSFIFVSAFSTVAAVARAQGTPDATDTAYAALNGDTGALAAVKKHAHAGEPEWEEAMGGYYKLKDQLPLAVRWFAASAAQGNVDGAFNLAEMLNDGDGAKQDYASADKWFAFVMRKSDPYGNATERLGEAYLNGRGVAKDEMRGLSLLERSAQMGNGMAMDTLGMAYGNGQGVKRDLVQAGEWFILAAYKKDANGVLHLAQAEKGLTRPQFEEAKARAASWSRAYLHQ